LKNKALILLVIPIAGVIIFFFATMREDGLEITSVGESVPDIKLVDINENTLRLSDMQGSVVLINFWATWCESCVDEMPSMDKLFRQFSEKPDFKLITIVYRDSLDNALSYLKENGYAFPVYSNPDNTAARKFGITGVPETFIIDKNGVLRNKVIGPANWDSPVFIEFVRSLMNEQG